MRYTKSLKSGVLQAFDEADGDGVIMIVDSDKSIQENGLRGQAITKAGRGLMEIYSEDKYVYHRKRNGKWSYVVTRRENKSDFKRDVYVIIHEIMHILSYKYTSADKLHTMVQQGKFVEYCRHICDVVNDFQQKMKKPVVQITKRDFKDIVHLEGYDLLPVVERKLKRVFEFMAADGNPMRVIEGYRSCERQDKLFNQVPKVTNARCGESLHQYGVAVDCNFLIDGYNAPEKLWKKFGIIAKHHGFEWGGDWRSFEDRPHIQYTLGHDVFEFKRKDVDMSEFN